MIRAILPHADFAQLGSLGIKERRAGFRRNRPQIGTYHAATGRLQAGQARP